MGEIMADTSAPAPAPSDEVALTAFPIVTDILHNVLIGGCSVGAAFGFWNGSTALGFTGLILTVAANVLSNIHVHKNSGVGKVISAVQTSQG
jgi:hypothetical protein